MSIRSQGCVTRNLMGAGDKEHLGRIYCHVMQCLNSVRFTCLLIFPVIVTQIKHNHTNTDLYVTFSELHYNKMTVHFPWHCAFYLQQTVSRFYLKTQLCPNQTPHWKTMSVFGEQMPAQTNLPARTWQWWTRVHGENESWGQRMVRS